MTVEIYHIEPRSPAWLALRKPLLTASDVGAVAGVDAFRTAFEVYMEKTGASPGLAETSAMRRGRLGEVMVEGYIEEELPGFRILNPKVFLADRELGLGATPDRLLEDPQDPETLINCQIKIVNKGAFERWEGKAPLSNQLQVATENMLLDAGRGILAVLAIGTYDAELHLFDVERNAGAEQRIRDIARDFWNNVRAGRRPAPDYHRDAETITAMFPHAEPGTVLDLSGDNRLPALLEMRSILKDELAGIKKDVDAIDAEIELKLGEAEAAALPGWRITWKEESRKAYTVAASSSRRLRIKELPDEKEQAA